MGSNIDLYNLKNIIKKIYQGKKVPIDFKGSFPVSSPNASLTLLAMNSAFFVRSAYPLIPVLQAS